MSEDGLSVEELAARAGLTVRTIRYYQSEGLLPPPERHGRTARYGPEHLERLRLITDLQDRGLRLAAITELLAAAPDTATATDWLGLGETLSRPWSDDHPVLLDEAELRTRLAGVPGGSDRPGLDRLVEGLTAGGLVERRADTVPVVYLVPSPGLLDVALTSLRLGIGLDTGLRLRRTMELRLRDLADELTRRFTEEVSVERLAGGGPGALASLLDQIRPLTRRTVDLVFAHEMERALRALLDAATPDDSLTA